MTKELVDSSRILNKKLHEKKVREVIIKSEKHNIISYTTEHYTKLVNIKKNNTINKKSAPPPQEKKKKKYIHKY